MRRKPVGLFRVGYLLSGVLPLVLGIPKTSAQQQGPPANVAIVDLVDGYLQQRGNIRNMRVKYSDVRVWPDDVWLAEHPDPEPGEVRQMHVDRIEEGDKYRIRFSKSPQGFDDSSYLVEGSYDGSISMSMRPGNRTGRISEGMEDVNLSSTNSLSRYILADNLAKMLMFNAAATWDERRFNVTMFEEKLRRPHEHLHLRPVQERVNGMWCHVVEVYMPGDAVPGDKVLQHVMYVAADEGCLPLKYDTYVRGILVNSVEMAGVREIETAGGKVWLPAEIRHTRFYEGAEVIREVKIEAVELNLDLDENDFRLQFPAGTRVYDTISQTHYTVDSPTATEAGVQTMVEAIAEAESRRESPFVPATEGDEDDATSTATLDVDVRSVTGPAGTHKSTALGTASWTAITVGVAGILLWASYVVRQRRIHDANPVAR